MGFEVDSIEEYPCKCGKGKLEIIHKSDDWNRSQEEYVIICEECKNKYYVTPVTSGIKERFLGYQFVLKNKPNK